MKGRNKMFITITSIVIVILIIFVALDGTFLKKKYNAVWTNRYVNAYEDDISKIIAYALGATSGHNMQPWLVKINDNQSVELYANMEKALPVIDSTHKQLLMSQGTFIEKFKQGALKYGYNVNIEYTQLNLNNSMPLIAALHLTNYQTKEVDTISSSTMVVDHAQQGDKLTQVLNTTLETYEGLTFEFIESGETFLKLQEMLLQGTIIESKDVEATKELLNVFRWTEWEKNKYRYGLSLTTMPSLLKPFIQPIMKGVSKDIEGFGKSSISLFEDRLKKETGYIFIKCKNPTALDYIYAGQIYQELIFNTNGYILRPAVQVLEEFQAMKELNAQFQREFGADGEVVLLITVQPQTNTKATSNPRHMVEDILITE